MNSKLLLSIALITMFQQLIFSQTGYKYQLDLRKIEDDSLYIEVIPPKVTENSIDFNFPAIVPGVYAKANYGRLIGSLKALDIQGLPLPVSKKTINTWTIDNARKLHKITYKSSDTYDLQTEQPIFWPAGTNFETGNVILNAPGYLGYISGYKNNAFEVNISRNHTFYPITGLEFSTNNQEQDIFRAGNYDLLVDSPIMYSVPDTTWIDVAETKVLIGVYSPNSKITSKQIGNRISTILMGQKEYLGGELPVAKYAFIFYFTPEQLQFFGALEHSLSSIYYMQENNIEQLESTLRNFTAHEFFHIITPLNIHSEEVADFDFIQPKMSKHLWLYEGVTEYFSGHMQLASKIISPDNYLEILAEKFRASDGYIKNLALTEMSEFILEKHIQQFPNIYHKGALTNLAFDIHLLKYSNAQYGLRDLMSDLLKKYGKNEPFQEDGLFEVIEELAGSQARVFIDNYIAGNKAIPMDKYLAEIGIAYLEEVTVLEPSLGFFGMQLASYNDRQYIGITDQVFNEMGETLGLKQNDILLSINGQEIPEAVTEKRPFINAKTSELKEGEVLKMKVARKSNGIFQELELEAKISKVEIKKRHQLSWIDNPNNSQSKLKRAWITNE